MKTLAIFALLCGLCSQHLSAEAKRPNVIFILTDDQGWGDAHFAGHPCVKTPGLDRFASQSTWVKQFFDTNKDGVLSEGEFVTMGKR